MLGVKNYTQDYVDDCRARVNLQLATYKDLITTAKEQSTTSKSLDSAIEAFESVFFNNMILLLDNLFVHRLRTLEKKDGNPLNEVRVMCNSLLLNQGNLMKDKQIKLDPTKSILKYQVGDEIRLSQGDFMRLSEAFFTEIENKYVQAEQVI